MHIHTCALPCSQRNVRRHGGGAGHEGHRAARARGAGAGRDRGVGPGLGRTATVHHLSIRFILDPRTYSVPLYLKRQCGRTLEPEIHRVGP